LQAYRVLVGRASGGHAARLGGEHERARALADEGLALARSLGDSAREVWMLDVLGLVALAEGEYARASAIFTAALPLAEKSGDWRYLAGLRSHLGLAALGEGNTAAAADFARLGLDLGGAVGLRRGIAYALDIVASVAATRNRPDHASRLFGAAEALREADGLAQWSPLERAIFERHLPPLRAALGESGLAAAWAAGRGLTQQEAVALALEAAAH
jgi:hypothetical protein